MSQQAIKAPPSILRCPSNEETRLLLAMISSRSWDSKDWKAIDKAMLIIPLRGHATEPFDRYRTTFNGLHGSAAQQPVFKWRLGGGETPGDQDEKGWEELNLAELKTSVKKREDDLKKAQEELEVMEEDVKMRVEIMKEMQRSASLNASTF